MFMVCLYIGTVECFTNISLAFLVETGSAVCIKTLRILQVVSSIFPKQTSDFFCGYGYAIPLKYLILKFGIQY